MFVKFKFVRLTSKQKLKTENQIEKITETIL